MTLALPIEGVTPRVQEIGRIRLGEKGPKGAPVKLKTFRLTSNDRRVLEAAAALYGGKVAEWRDAPDEGMWQVVTAAAELDILIPRSLRSVSQAWELWKGGTCERRCDGRIEELSGNPCICGPARGSSDDLCDVVTRLSVILPRLPGLGLWRLDSGGWGAASTIPSTLDLLLAIDPRPMVPAVLRAVQASSKVRENGRVITHRYVRPQLDAPGITIGQLVGLASEPMAQIADGGDRPAPLTAEERVARQRADVEARRALETTPIVDAATAEFTAAEIKQALTEPGAAAVHVDEAPPPQEIPGEVVAVPSATGLSMEAFAGLVRQAGKRTQQLASALDCVPADVGRRVEAMSDVERGVLADELNLDWREQ